MFKHLFKTTDLKIFKKLGKIAYVRNGVGYGFVSDEYLYDGCLLEIGIGRVTSGYGDWGGGATHASDSPLKIVIDKDYIIKKITTHSFYNSNSFKRTEKEANKFAKTLRVGKVFIVKDVVLKRFLDKYLKALPLKAHIGHDVFKAQHMEDFYLDKQWLIKNLRDIKN